MSYIQNVTAIHVKLCKSTQEPLLVSNFLFTCVWIYDRTKMHSFHLLMVEVFVYFVINSNELCNLFLHKFLGTNQIGILTNLPFLKI